MSVLMSVLLAWSMKLLDDKYYPTNQYTSRNNSKLYYICEHCSNLTVRLSEYDQRVHPDIFSANFEQI